jgi:hypothetical protein
MRDLVAPLALVVAVVNTAAAVAGLTHVAERAFWLVLRAGQVGAVALAALAAASALSGDGPGDGLFWLYALLPIAVGLIGEQLRLASAETVLEARGLADAQEMRRLPDREQRDIVVAILHREMTVMACAAGVVAFLALRAATTW